MRRHWKVIMIAAVVAALALTVAAVALGAGQGRIGRTAAAACGALMSDPEALSAMRELRAEHQQDMRAWTDAYRADPDSAAAREALQKLRQEHRNEMRDLLERFGVDVPENAGPGANACTGGCGGGRGTAGTGSGAGFGRMMGGSGMMSGASF